MCDNDFGFKRVNKIIKMSDKFQQKVIKERSCRFHAASFSRQLNEKHLFHSVSENFGISLETSLLLENRFSFNKQLKWYKLLCELSSIDLSLEMIKTGFRTVSPNLEFFYDRNIEDIWQSHLVK
jgi:hypothetical protein